MNSEHTAIEDWAATLMRKLTPVGRRKVAHAIASALRRNQQQRIAAQRAPEGQPFVPRKPRQREKRGRIKRKAMFIKLRTAHWLKTTATPDMASVGYTGRTSRIALVHQYGEMDAVAKGGPCIRYPQRRLLGFSETDRAMIRDLLIDHLAR